jgi:hypothetical protein
VNYGDMPVATTMISINSILYNSLDRADSDSESKSPAIFQL